MLPEGLYATYLACRKVTTDTRNLHPGSIFFALKGANFDGNGFVAEAMSSGCSAAVSDDPANAGIPGVFIVDDTLQCLQELAQAYRKSFHFPVFGITGSNGKTTSKELLREVLAQKFRVHATRGNLNNHIGVPLTLLEIGPEIDFAIIEMGANHQGEIRELSSIADPDFGLITNIGKAHLEGFGGPEGVRKGKKELFDHLERKSGKVFVSGRQENLLEISEGMDRIVFGPKGCDIETEVLQEAPTLTVGWSEKGIAQAAIATQLTGAYNLDNVGAAIAVGRWFGVNAQAIVLALQGYTPSNQRSQLTWTSRNAVILDAYNANPSSMEVALKNLSVMHHARPYFILGDMKELGESSLEEHQRIVDLCRELGLTGAFVGSDFKQASKPAGLRCFDTTAEALEFFREHPLNDSLILLKGSRSMKLESLMEVL